MVFKEAGISPPPKPDEKAPVQSAIPTGNIAPAASAATVIVPLMNKKLLFCHAEGWNLEIAAGDVLGRANGNHSARLGAFPVISSNHAKITREGDGWYITDLKSTNKTWVNSAQAQPGVPARIKNNDVVQLANVSFAVREP
jgi:hypothetical protein